MTASMIHTLVKHKNAILRNVAARLLPLLFCKNSEIEPLQEGESCSQYIKRIGKSQSFRLNDEDTGADLVFSRWGIPQFFPNHLKYLSAPEFFLSQPVVYQWLTVKLQGQKLGIEHIEELITTFRLQEAQKYKLLDLYQDDPNMASYALMHVEIHKWIRGFIKLAAGLDTPDLPLQSHARLREPATPYLLEFIKQWTSKNKKLTPEMEKFIDYLLSASNDKIIGFPEFKSNFLIGLVGEQILAEEMGGTVVGGLGYKTDVSVYDQNFSIKTTKNDHWQSHLAYLSVQDHPQIMQLLNKNMSLRELGYSDEQWAAFLHNFMCAEDNLGFIVFQKLQLQDASDTILHQNVWICRTSVLIDLVRKGQYFFRNSSLSIVAPNKEVIISLQIKRRNEGKKIQVMINTDIHLLNNAAACVKGISTLKYTQPF